MKKRMVSLLLAALMLLTLLPVTAMAEEYGITVAGTQVTSENKNNVTAAGIRGEVSYDPVTNTLMLASDTSIEYDDKCISVSGLDTALTIQFGANCSLTSNNNDAIYLAKGDVILTGGDLTICASGDGIYQDYVDTDDSVTYTCGVTMQDCGSVEVIAGLHAIYAGGVWIAEEEDNDTDYRFGGKVTITNCTQVKLNNENSGDEAVHANGGITVRACPNMQVISGGNALYSRLGDVCIDNCKLDIAAAGNGIRQDYVDTDASATDIPYTCSVTLKDCDSVEITATGDKAIYAGGVWNKEDTYCRFGGDVTIENCDKVEIVNAKNDAIWANGDVTIKDCTAEGGAASIKVEAGNNAIYAPHGGDMTIDNCDKVELNTIGGNSKAVKVDGNVTVKGSDVRVESKGEQGGIWTDNSRTMTIDNSTVSVWTEKHIGIDTGTLNVKNGSSLVAVTNDLGNWSAVYCHAGMTVSNSEFFASAASYDAIGCPKNAIRFSGKTLYGDAAAVSYENRDTVNTSTRVGYYKPVNEYTAMMGLNTPAKTVYYTSDRSNRVGSLGNLLGAGIATVITVRSINCTLVRTILTMQILRTVDRLVFHRYF